MAYTKEQMASAAGVIDSGKGVNKKVNVSNESLSAGSYEGAMARREASGGRVGDGMTKTLMSIAPKPILFMILKLFRRQRTALQTG